MPLQANALLTVADVRESLGITGTTQDAMIEDLINEASDEIEAWCGRPLKEQDVAAAEFAGQIGCQLRPSTWPIDPDAMVSVILDGTALTVWRKASDGDPATFDVEVRGDVPGGPKTFFYRAAGWLGSTRFPIVASFTAGYAVIPGNLKAAARLVVQTLHRHRKGLEPYQSYPAGATGGTVTVRADTIPKTARELLAPFVAVIV